MHKVSARILSRKTWVKMRNFEGGLKMKKAKRKKMTMEEMFEKVRKDQEDFRANYRHDEHGVYRHKKENKVVI